MFGFKKKSENDVVLRNEQLQEENTKLQEENTKLKKQITVFKEFSERIIELKSKHGMKAIIFNDKIKSAFEVPAIQATQEYLKTIGVKKDLTQEQILWAVRCFITEYPVVSCSIEHDVRFKAVKEITK